jgi:hypothetical protein
VGETVGSLVGAPDGNTDGRIVGYLEDSNDGYNDGRKVGFMLTGLFVGTLVGLSVEHLNGK